LAASTLAYFQHSPSSCAESELGCEVFDFRQWQSFGKSIGNHVDSGTEYEVKLLFLNNPMNKVEMDVNMFSASVILVILS
jgi:hypothetical protein